MFQLLGRLEYVKGDKMPEAASSLVSFRRNTRIQDENFLRRKKTGFTSKYIGLFQDGNIGFIFPGNRVIEEVIEGLESRGPKPWPLRVFVKKVSEGAFLAFSIDDFSAHQDRPLSEPTDKRIERIEQKLCELESGMNELKSLVSARGG